MQDSAALAPIFKVRYGKFQNPLPENNTFAQFSTFVPKEERPGRRFEFPIQISGEQGVTFDNTDDAFSVEPAIAAEYVTAVIDGSNIMMRADMSYAVLARGRQGSGNGNSGGSYFDPWDKKIEDTMKGGERFRELAITYGPGTSSAALCNIGVTAAAAISGADLSAGQVVRLTTASWSPGMWNALLKAKIDIYESDATTLRETGVKVTAINPSNCRLTLQKDGSTASVGSGDVLLMHRSKGRTCAGIQAILENTGELFEVDAAEVPMWRAQQMAVGGALSRAKIGQFASKIAPTGLEDGGKLFMGAAAFHDLTEETSLLQRYTANTDKTKRQGAANLLYTTAIGEINATMHSYMKQGFAFFIARDVLKRVGSTDLTFSSQGSNEWFAQDMENSAGIQIRLFTNQAPIVEIPWYCGIMSTIASTADIASA